MLLRQIPNHRKLTCSTETKSMAHFFMCLIINVDEQEIDSPPVFFKTIYEARVYGYSNAKRIQRLNYSELHSEWNETLGVCIFKVPFGAGLHCNDISMDSNIWEYFIRTILDRETKAAKTIQRWYRNRYIDRVCSAVLIQTWYREAIANPYTQLCQNRLKREFREMS